MSCNLSWCRLQKKYLKKRQGDESLEAPPPKVPRRTTTPDAAVSPDPKAKAKARAAKSKPSKRRASWCVSDFGMSWEILRHDMAVYTMGWSHLDQIKTWFQRWKLSVIIVYLQSCMIHVLAWKKWNCHWCWSIHPVGFTIFCFMGDTRGADHAFRSSKQTWEKIAYMRWIQPFVLLLINKEHCWIMIHLTVCQVSLLAKFSVVLHPTSAMEFQPQQVWVKVAEHAWSNHRWAYHSI